MANKKELNIRILMDKLIKKEKEIEACDTSYNINTKYYRQQLINEKNEIIKLLK